MQNLTEAGMELFEDTIDDLLEHGVVTSIDKENDIENYYSHNSISADGATVHPKTTLHISSPTADLELTIKEPSKLMSYDTEQNNEKTTSFVASNDVDSEQCPVCKDPFDEDVWDQVGSAGDRLTTSVSYNCPCCGRGKIHIIY